MPVALEATSRAYLKLLQKQLSARRLSHSVSTAEFLSSFAPALGVDHGEAVTAGLFHDFYRDRPADLLLLEAERFGLIPSPAQKQQPMLLHGHLAAEWCRRELAVSDAVHEAMGWHTTGRPGLGLLGQALFLADFCEPSRSYPQAEEARRRLDQQGFEAALLYTAHTRRELSRQKSVIDPNTEAFLEWLKTRGTA